MADEPEEPEDEAGRSGGRRRGAKSPRWRSSPSARTSRRPPAGRPAGAPRWPAPTRRCSGRPTRSIPSSSASAPRAKASRSSCGARRRARRGFVHELVRDRQPLVLTGDGAGDGRSRSCAACRRRSAACLAVPLEAEGIIVGLLALFFTEIARRGRRAGPPRALPRAGRAGARPRPALRAQDRRHAPRDRAADQPLRPLQGVRLDDRHRRALGPDRAQGRRLRDAPRSPRSGSLDGDEDVARWPRRPSTRTTTSSRRPTPSAPRSSATSSPTRRRSGATASPTSDPLASENEGYPIRSVLAVPARRGRGRRSAPSCSSTSAAAIPSSRARTRSCWRTSRARPSAPCTTRASTRPRRRSRSSTRCSPSAARSPRRSTSTRSCRRSSTRPSALIPYDRCGIAHPREGQAAPRRRLRRRTRSTARTRASSAWRSCSSGSSSRAPTSHVTQTEDGEITADRPETEEKFRAIFQETGLRSFFGVAPQGRGRQARRPRLREQGAARSSTRRRATCSRSSSTRRPSPSATRSSTSRCRWPGSCKPLLERRRQLLGDPGAPAPGLGHRRAARRCSPSSSCPGALRVAGPVRVLPGQPRGRDAPASTASSRRSCTARATASQAGRRHRDAQGRVLPGGAGRGPVARSRSPRARWRATRRRATPARCSRPGPGATSCRRAARSPRSSWPRRGCALPPPACIVTPHIEQRVGQALARGAEFAIVADVRQRHGRGRGARVRRRPRAGRASPWRSR